MSAYQTFNEWKADYLASNRPIQTAQNEQNAETALSAASTLENRGDFELAQEAMDLYLYFIDNPGVPQ